MADHEAPRGRRHRGTRRWPAGAVLLVLLAGCSSSGSDAEPSPSGTLVAISGGQGPSPDAVRFLLEHDGTYRRAALGLSDDDVPVFCGVDLLGSSQDERLVYAWAQCSTFRRDGDAVEETSGVSGPVLVNMSFQKATVPGDGAQYAADVRRLFPPDVAERMLAQDVHVDQDADLLRKRAAAELVTNG